MRMPFHEIFDEVDGRFLPRVHIAIDPIAFAAGASIAPTLRISGIEIRNLRNRDLDVEAEGGIITIQGLFQGEVTPRSHHGRPVIAQAPRAPRRAIKNA